MTFSCGLRVLGALLVACLGLRAGAAEQPELPAIAILIDADRQLSVREVTGTLQVGPKTHGLVVWEGSEREGWAFLAPGQKWAQARSNVSDSDESTTGTRGTGAPSADSGGGLFTVQLDQLRITGAVRAADFLTPPTDGVVLQPTITIRRTPPQGKDRLPATVAEVVQDGKVLVSIAFKENQDRIAWADIPDLPENLRKGLPPGACTLRFKKGGVGEGARFTVASARERNQVLARSNELATLLGDRTDPGWVQATVEDLLDYRKRRAEDRLKRSYLADALDVLEAVPAAKKTPYLKRLREHVLLRLKRDPGGPGAPTASLAAGSMGKAGDLPEAIQEIRGAIAASRWSDAEKQLDALKRDKKADARLRALADLYHGVVLAESGLGKEMEAGQAYRRAIKGFAGGRNADLFRAHNNYATFLLNRAEDRLHNQSFQIAAGVQSPIYTSLASWLEARRQYELAMKFAAGADQKAAVGVNLAQLDVLLADLIVTVDAAVQGERKLVDAENAATARARAEAVAAAKQSAHGDPLIAALAWEVQAHLAYRAREFATAREQAGHALKAYTQAGALAGQESAHRLIGLCFLRINRAGAKADALKHFRVSHLLAELLRERLPADDKVGLSRAGFFARRAYVNEKIVELLLEQDRPAEALRYAELAKARALQDLLATHGQIGNQGSAHELGELLADWPKQVAAVEYFLGSEKGWVFVVDGRGKVKAHPLAKKTSGLVARVRRFLADTGAQAGKMVARINAGQGFDHTWQETLHQFSTDLLPGDVLQELKRAKTVVVVPHHILHYFPFAALVTKLDTRKRTAAQMVEPRFLIDEEFTLSYAPSLLSWDLLRQRTQTPITRVQAVGIAEFEDAESLPGVETELKELRDVFGKRVATVLTGEAATRSKIKDLFRRPGMLLIGTHGMNLADQPLDSHLLCRREPNAEPILTAGEIFTSKVNADLVVLSACYSGLADRSPLPGDDLFGLQRAFLQSGARTVMSGLWDVYDGTAPHLMLGFFKNLSDGKPAAEALARSQRDFLKKLRGSKAPQPWLHPYFWAVYTVCGDDRTRFRK